MTSQTPAMLAAIIADRDQTIASLRDLLKSKDDEIADLKRDCSRLQGRLAHAEEGARPEQGAPDLLIYQGKVSSFDMTTSRGVIWLDACSELGFHSTCFQSALPTRCPIVGERVKATFQGRQLISVRSIG